MGPCGRHRGITGTWGREDIMGISWGCGDMGTLRDIVGIWGHRGDIVGALGYEDVMGTRGGGGGLLGVVPAIVGAPEGPRGVLGVPKAP